MSEHIREFKQASHMVVQYQFDRLLTLDVAGMPFPVIGMQLQLDTSLEWMAKVLEIEADLGRFDAQTGLLWVPAGATMTFWGMDDTGWESVEEPTQEERTTGNVGQILLHAYLGAQFMRASGGTPNLTKHVADMKVSISSYECRTLS